MKATVRPVIALTAWVLALIGLLRIGRGPLSTPPVTDVDRLRIWMDGRDGVEAAFAFLRLGAIAVAGYLVVTTALGLLARTTRSVRLARLTELATVPTVRRLVGGVAGVGLSASVVTLSASTPAPTRDRVAVAADADPPSDGLVIERLPAEPRDAHHGTATMHVVPAADPAPPPAPAPTWAVAAGESFWLKSESVLKGAWGREPTDREIAAYSNSLIAVNRSRLSDPGNPDLIFTGQVFELPPPPAG